MPDVYRGPYRADDPAAGARYAREVARAIERAEAAGRSVAAFICESLLGCGGQIVLPDGYLERAYAAVRAAGGVAIADEVQVGFGRVGTHVWGFETQGVVPDIVTLGKPIGNGFPLGAVVTRPEIADAFDNGMEYFNTFGGTQAACAVGLAVLDVMRDEGLQAHALEVGARLKRGLERLIARLPHRRRRARASACSSASSWSRDRAHARAGRRARPTTSSTGCGTAVCSSAPTARCTT